MRQSWVETIWANATKDAIHFAQALFRARLGSQELHWPLRIGLLLKERAPRALFLCIMGFVLAGAASVQESDRVLFQLPESAESALQGSRFGTLADFQQALSGAVQSHGNVALKADGVLGPKTRLAVAEYRKFGRSGGLVIDEHLWQELLPRVAPPGVHERAFVLSLSHEGTDYDQIEWNYETNDDASALTWGPYGATAGHGNEIRGILRRINEIHPDLLDSIFGDEYPAVKKLLAAPASQGYKILKPVYSDAARREKWKQLFATLGAQPEAREAYEWYAFDSGLWLVPPMKQLYSLLPSHLGTEIDYAYFLDLGIQLGGFDPRKIEQVQRAIAAAQGTHRLAPAERRQIISRVLLLSVAQRQDRMGRNVCYFIDGLGKKRLSVAEWKAWGQRSGLRASDCGLSDDRVYVPEFLHRGSARSRAPR
jgi:peptidoglycan hydrolase-like protein with peptidoglycan-binding domain